MPVNPLAGTVVVAGTLATAGLLLDSEITAPSGAADVMTTVPLDGVATDDGGRVVVDRRQLRGRRAACGREAAHGRPRPGDARRVDAANAPEVGRRRPDPVVAYIDVVTLCSRTSGAVNALESSIWIVYDTALGRIVPVERDRLWLRRARSPATPASARRARRGCRRRRRRGVDVELGDERVAPEDREVAVPDAVERTDRGGEVLREGRAGDVDVAGRVAGDVAGRRRPVRAAEERREAAAREPVGFSSAMIASPAPLNVASGAPAVTGKSAELVPPVSQALPAGSTTTELNESPADPPTNVEYTNARAGRVELGDVARRRR